MKSPLLLVTAFLATVGAQRYEPCNVQELTSGQDRFNTQLGIDANDRVLTSQKLMNDIENIFANEGNAGLARSAFTNFQDYDRCLFEPMGLLVSDADGTASGITEAQARTYVKLFTSLDFACGPGFAHFFNHESCMKAGFADQAGLRACQTQFESSRTQDAGETCAYLQRSTNCYMSRFREGSCDNLAKWFACEYQRMGLESSYGQCSQIFCKYTST